MLTVMTWNIFLGADLRSVYRALATTEALAAVPRAVAAIFHRGEPPGIVQRTDFARRAAALAGAIAAARPDVIGLQEVPVWRVRADGGETATIDHLERLEEELRARGAPYRRAAVVVSGDVELPSAAGGTVALTNRGAVLVRDDGDVQAADAQTGSFTAALPVQTVHGTFPLTRGWAAADVTRDGLTVRFVSTHLEVATSPEAADVQRRQAAELLAGPAATDLPVVLVGDFNAAPGTVTYEDLRSAAFDDAWQRAGDEGSDGLTCCHRIPLDDPADRLRTRIDLILTRGALRAVEAIVVGDEPPVPWPGRWPSDHAGVVARLAPCGMVS
jgi:endonuclease/exonuclease/phosphatase family metal-dependent hydrolase